VIGKAVAKATNIEGLIGSRATSMNKLLSVLCKITQFKLFGGSFASQHIHCLTHRHSVHTLHKCTVCLRAAKGPFKAFLNAASKLIKLLMGPLNKLIEASDKIAAICKKYRTYAKVYAKFLKFQDLVTVSLQDGVAKTFYPMILVVIVLQPPPA
jgi:hypothetical protein